jgi:hypothetical protein
MSRIYHFLTHDPDYRPGEPRNLFYRRVNRRRAIQRLLIRSFPIEFQRLDERLYNEAVHKAKGDKDSLVSGVIATFTGRERLARAMAGNLRDRLHPEDSNKLKALEWVKGSRYQPILIEAA